MAKSPFTRRDEQREVSRRALIKWTLACGAGLGVSRSKVYEILEKHSGKGVALAAATCNTKNFIFMAEGSGGLSMMTQFFMPIQGVASARNPAFSWAGDSTTGDLGSAMAGTDFPAWTYGDDPWKSRTAEMYPAAFFGGTNTTHNDDVTTTTFGINGKSIPAFAAELQVQSLPFIVPALAIGVNPGPSSVPFATAGNVAAATALFDSLASRANGLLSISGNADLYAQHQDVLVALNKVAKNPVQGVDTIKGAARFVGKNLAAQLQVTAAEILQFAGTSTLSNGATRYAQALIFALKAMQLGLTHTIAFRGFTNDPHGFFDSGIAGARAELKVIRQIVKSFIEKADTVIDPVCGAPLSRNLVIAGSGDTYKAPFNQGGWGDGTPGNSSIIFTYSGGDIKSGWHGNVTQAGGPTVLNAAGQNIAYNANLGLRAAMGGIAYSLTNRDKRAAETYLGGPMDDLMIHYRPLIS
jgi:hypothetical protein